MFLMRISIKKRMDGFFCYSKLGWKTVDYLVTSRSSSNMFKFVCQGPSVSQSFNYQRCVA